MRRRQVFAQAGVKSRPVAQKTPAELYEEKFGKKPHHRLKPETIMERLKDGNASNGSSEVR